MGARVIINFPEVLQVGLTVNIKYLAYIKGEATLQDQSHSLDSIDDGTTIELVANVTFADGSILQFDLVIHKGEITLERDFNAWSPTYQKTSNLLHSAGLCYRVVI